MTPTRPPDAHTRSPRTRHVLLVVWCASVLYAVGWLDHGWIPHDEGTLAHSAERVLQGELPHRDFDEGYTGGLTLLNAAAFHFLGVSLYTLRIPLLVAFTAWIPALFYVATRFVGQTMAGAVVLLAVTWSLPSYAAPLPSWYNLFLAGLALASMLRYLETDRRRWLLAAGACAGLSCLIKIVGLYVVAAGLLTIAFHEQFLARMRSASPGRRGPSSAYVWTARLILLVFTSLVVWMVLDTPAAREVAHFVFPVVALAGFYVWNEPHTPGLRSRDRFATIARLVGPFLLGVGLPIVLFVIPYALSGALDALWTGVFAQSLRQVSVARARPPSLLATTVATAPLVLVLAMSFWRGGRATTRAVVVGLILAGILAGAAVHPFTYRLVWYSVRALVPVVVALGVILLSAQGIPWSMLRRQQALAVLSVTTLVSLVQFPFSTPVYFLYVAPLLAVSLVAIFPPLPVRSPVPGLVLAFYLLFAALWVNGAIVQNIGFVHARARTDTLEMNRGGIRVSPSEKREYEDLVSFLQTRTGGPFIYAAPDCPEVYFLSGFRNPTRTFFDYHDLDYRAAPASRAARILDVIERRSVDVVVVNREPGFSGALSRHLTGALAERFPETTSIGRFEIRWRERSRPGDAR